MKNIKTIILAGCLIIAVNLSNAQKIIDKDYHTWWANINKYTFNEKWFGSSEIHVRRADWINGWQQFLIRPAINYNISPTVTFTIGYTFIMNWPYGNQPVPLQNNEHNIWEQMVTKGISGNWSFTNRFRLENRFPDKITENNGNYYIDGRTFSNRFRYRFIFAHPIKKYSDSKTLYFSGFDEFFILIDNNFMPYAFNQNWTYLSIGLKVNKSKWEIGYLHQIIRKNDGIHYEINPTISVAYKRNIAFN